MRQAAQFARMGCDDADAEHEVEEANVSRLQSLALVEQRGLSFGLTLMDVRKVAQLKRS